MNFYCFVLFCFYLFYFYIYINIWLIFFLSRRAKVLKNHFALLTAKEKVQFVKNMGDVSAGFHKNHMKLYDKVIKNMGSHNNWKRRIKTRAIDECLNFQRSYVDKGTDVVVNKSLLKLCRNSATHLWESLLEVLINILIYNYYICYLFFYNFLFVFYSIYETQDRHQSGPLLMKILNAFWWKIWGEYWRISMKA